MPVPRIATAFVALLLAGCASSALRFSGTVQTEYSDAGSTLGGRVIETDVSAGQRVARGAVIVRLDPSIVQAELDEATAAFAAAKAREAQALAGPVATDVERAAASSRAARASYMQSVAAAPQELAAARASIVSARADETLARQSYARTASLAATGDVSRQSLDQARASFDSARANVRAAQARYDELQHATVPGTTRSALGNAQSAQAAYRTLRNGTRPEELAQARADERNAAAAVARARARLDELTVRSPIDGVVSSFDLHRGDMLAPNQPAAVIDSFANPYAYIYASQSDLARLRAAKSLRVRADSGAGTFSARVEAFDRTAQFTPQNVETADQRADLVYGVKIRIDDPQHTLLDGTTITVELQ